MLRETIIRKPVPSGGDASKHPDHVLVADDKLPAPAISSGATSSPVRLAFLLGLLDRLDVLASRFLPRKTYLRLPRRYFALSLLLLLLLLLILVIVLPVTLTRKSSSSASLPLPSGAKTYTGDGTYYNPALGACGIESGDNDMICAIAHSTFDAMQPAGVGDPNQNTACGRKIRVVKEGETTGIQVTVVDRCVGCASTDLDLSPKAFSELADMALGRIKIEWAWV